MAQEISRFFDYDEVRENEYQADEWAEFFRTFFADGVPELNSNLQVVAPDAGMQVNIIYGVAMVFGYWYGLKDNGTGPKSMQIAAAHASLARIDRVVLRLNKDFAVMSIALVILPGIPSANPEPTALTREGNIYEISLAKVRIEPGVSDITTDKITDERSDVNACGLAISRAVIQLLAAKADAAHTHAISAITGLLAVLDGKAPSVHTHAISATTGLLAALDGKAAASHDQEMSTIIGLIDALAGKLSTADGAVGTSNLGTITEITMGSGTKIKFNNSDKTFRLAVSGCAEVPLAPVLFGTSVSPPTGTYPKGTLYFQYE